MRRALSRRLEKVEAVTRTKSSNAERLWFGLPPRVILEPVWKIMDEHCAV